MRSSRTVAVLDIGTNAALLLIAHAPHRRFEALIDREEITGLGRGVHATRALARDAIARGLETLQTYATVIDACGVDAVAAIGTSALRIAENRDEFVGPAERILSTEIEIISGQREAELAYRGALQGFALAGPITVFDIGGGSTEVASGIGEELREAVSLDLGSVRLTEMFFRSDPPTEQECQALREHIEETIARSSVPIHGQLIGTAGTVTTLAALTRTSPPDDASIAPNERISQTSLRKIVCEIATCSTQERISRWGLDPMRADVLAAGGLLCEALLDASGAVELVASTGGIRTGRAAELLNLAVAH